MKALFFLTVAIFFSCMSCKESVISINDLYRSLNNDQVVSVEIEGRVENITDANSSTVQRCYQYAFITSDTCFSTYTSVTDMGTADSVGIGKELILLKHKYDPLSLRIYKCQLGVKSYLAFIGKAQSASGSGVQLTLFSLIETANNKAVLCCEFESRFGTINSLADLNNDGKLDFIKIKNGSKTNEFICTACDVYNNDLGLGSITLRYEQNDKFKIIDNNWSVIHRSR